MSGRTAEQMRWYKNRAITEGVISHPTDEEGWKEFDNNCPDFTQEVLNVKLALQLMVPPIAMVLHPSIQFVLL